MTAMAAAERRSTLEVPGARLSICELGPVEAAPLLTLHGGPGESHHALRPFLDALASERRRVVYYDQRGGGDSALVDDAPHAGIEEHARDVERVCAHLGPRPVDVLAFSWGALVAIAHALAHPERVSRLVLVSPPSFGEGDVGARLAAASDRPAVRALLAELERSTRRGEDAGARRARFAARVAPVLFDPRVALRLAAVDVNEAARDAASRSVRPAELMSQLHRLGDIRSLLVVGAEDPVSAPGADALAAALGARRLTIPACGHAPFAEAPDAFARGVEAFLDDAPGADR